MVKHVGTNTNFFRFINAFDEQTDGRTEIFCSSEVPCVALVCNRTVKWHLSEFTTD